jgi:mannitol 2-dehydrogenase
LACLATLAGYQRTDEAMRNPSFYAYVETLLRDEIQPLLPPVPGMNTCEYRHSLLLRLSNPQMSDQLSRLARRGSEKIASFLLPSLREAIEQRRPHTLLLLALAGWIRYLHGVDVNGRPIQIDDPRHELMSGLATMDGANPAPILRHEIFSGLSAIPGFAERLHAMIADIDTCGVIPTLRRALRHDEQELVG